MNMPSYATSDLYLSAYLKAKGLRLQETKKDGRKTLFLFEDQPNRQSLIHEFFNGGLVNITAFKNAVQDLKTLVFNV